MKKIPKQAYTTEFKELAVQRVTDGEAVGVVVKELGLADQTLRNWIKATKQGKLKGAGSKTVTPDQMELSRLRAENGVCPFFNVRNELMLRFSTPSMG